MTVLSPGERSKLVKVLAMLGSNHDGERAAAGLLATRIVQSANLTWNDLLQPKICSPQDSSSNGSFSWFNDVSFCLRHLHRLNQWEQNFVQSLRNRLSLTSGQRRKLTEVVSELREAGAK